MWNKINKTKSWFFAKINKARKPLVKNKRNTANQYQNGNEDIKYCSYIN